MYKLCPKCRHVCPEDDYDCDCVGSGLIDRSNIAFVDKELINVASKLMDIGFRVNECKISDILFYQILGVEIQLLDLYMPELFANIPSGWRIEQYRYDTLEIDKICMYTTLRNNLVCGTAEDNDITIDLTISNMERWLDTLDDNAFKAVLALSGYCVDR